MSELCWQACDPYVHPEHSGCVAVDLAEAKALLARCFEECGADAGQLQGRNAQLAASALALVAGDAARQGMLAQFKQKLREVGGSREPTERYAVAVR